MEGEKTCTEVGGWGMLVSLGQNNVPMVGRDRWQTLPARR
jgi:hypothetical protein